ncbi:hypothetical protein L596_009532 [Steinernema carpocapsae]|uniref:Uncharacterized protein n=1 Tax=Steinernema carpocapsae TaxID=34508 RepID=A0A4U5PGE5_STECR|nr:hypothetical protein L596_009532 [Steinernema carpocapsae]
MRFKNLPVEDGEKRGLTLYRDVFDYIMNPTIPDVIVHLWVKPAKKILLKRGLPKSVIRDAKRLYGDSLTDRKRVPDGKASADGSSMEADGSLLWSCHEHSECREDYGRAAKGDERHSEIPQRSNLEFLVSGFWVRVPG